MNVPSFFGIPARRTGEASPPAKQALSGSDRCADSSSDSFRVVMVDDEELIRKLATGMARRIGVDLVAVATAPAALEMARSSHIDVLLADVLLGEGLDGIDLAKEIAALQPTLSVVLMSGYGAGHFDLQGLPATTQFLTKPFSTDSLMHCLTTAREHTVLSGG